MTDLSREQLQLQLVDAHGVTYGQATVAEAHRPPGLLHRAFSLILEDGEGRILLQQRAAAKTRFPLRWGNTCCGHPAAGEHVVAAATRRLQEELGLAATGLRDLGVHTYHAEDPVTGRVEHEYDHVLLGEIADGALADPDPNEVADLRWTTPAALVEDLARRPEDYAPWLAGVIDLLPVRAHGPRARREA